MSDDQTSQPRSWLEKLTDLFSDDPQSRQDIKDIVREAAKRSIVDADTLNIIEGALQVSDMQVRDIMIPRSQMVSVSIDDRISEFLPRIIRAAHSRIPVLASDDESEVVGLLLVKDLLPLALTGNTDSTALKDIMRRAIFVPESKRLNVLLHEFRAKRHHMAIVVDEFGGVSGLVTIEDVLEQIVGDIKDEYDPDDDANSIRDLANGAAIVKALTPVEDFNLHFNAQFSDDEFDTIGGIVMHYFGRVPEVNDSINIDGWLFTVKQSTSRQIELLEVKAQLADVEQA